MKYVVITCTAVIIDYFIYPQRSIHSLWLRLLVSHNFIIIYCSIINTATFSIYLKNIAFFYKLSETCLFVCLFNCVCHVSMEFSTGQEAVRDYIHIQ